MLELRASKVLRISFKQRYFSIKLTSATLHVDFVYSVTVLVSVVNTGCSFIVFYAVW